MEMNVSDHPIFQPIELWQRKLINRTVVAPMSRVSATSEGLATNEMKKYYRAFADGGFGIIISEGIYTDDSCSKSYVNQPGLVTSKQVAAWREVVQSVKQLPTLFFAQLMHGGALSQFSTATLAPSSTRPAGTKMPAYGGEGAFPLPSAMTLENIEYLKQGFSAAAENAYRAGFDGVEIHGANGYLLDQFLTPQLNQRTDSYGGSLRNRFRIIAEIIEGIKKIAPVGFIVGLRVSEGKVNDLTYRWQGGAFTARELMNEVKAASPDFVHVAVQTGEWERDSFYNDGASLASIAKEVTGLPVIANGGLHQLGKATIALNVHHSDLIAIGKAALSDPQWVCKTLRGKPVVEFDQDMLWPEATI